MQNDRLLKQVTICSVFLLMVALAFSYRNEKRFEVEAAGQALHTEATPQPEHAGQPEKEVVKKNTEPPQPTPTPAQSLPAHLTPEPRMSPTPIPTEAAGGVWAAVRGAESSRTAQELAKAGGRTIIIEKPIGVDTELKLEDLAVDCQIRLTIQGKTAGEFTVEHVYRIAEETFYEGAPPSPTPMLSLTPTLSLTPMLSLTPTPLSSVSDAPVASVSPAPGPIPDLSPEDAMSPWCNDPVRAWKLSEGVNEDGTESVTLLFTLDTVYAYRIVEDEYNYYICLLRPKDVYDKIVVVDAGHGGIDSGTYAKNHEYDEHEMNLSIVLYLKELLDATPEIKVYYTRVTDRSLTLSQRVGLANAVEADFFLSVHCNGNETRYLNGTEVLYTAAQDDWQGMNSKGFAQICMDKLDAYLGLKNLGLEARENNVTILKDAQVPVALAEVAYMSNASDMEQLAKERTRRAAAQALYEAILEGYRQLEQE
ncbi:MAG: N-acetylmuramoyl-L-alanine amidase [Lachnospiraceae bacterium]|nr:N-acetylmuramoyl-L-alanine amidase [Lachnospiraceae bacterium]